MTVKKSKIHGNGLFANRDYKPKEIIAPIYHEAILKWVNHSRTPNATFIDIRGVVYAVCIRPIRKDEEITLDYRHPLNPYLPAEYDFPL